MFDPYYVLAWMPLRMLHESFRSHAIFKRLYLLSVNPLKVEMNWYFSKYDSKYTEFESVIFINIESAVKAISNS